MRNRINLHTARDDSLLGTLKFVSKTKERQVYGALIPKEMIYEDILNFTAYQTYFAYASGAKEPKKVRKFKKPSSPKQKTVPVSPKEPTKKTAKKPGPTKKVVPVMKSSRKSQAGVIIKDTTGVSVSNKKALANGKRSKGDGADFESRVPDEQRRKISGTDEGTGTKPGVPDVPKYDSESEKKSWGDSREEDDDDEDDSEDVSDNDNGNDDDGDNDDNDDDSDDERTESEKDEIPDLNQTNKEHAEEEEYVEERVHTPGDYELTDDEKIDDKEKMDEEEDDEVTKELYKDMNVNLGNTDADMTNADQGGADQQNASQESGFEYLEEDAHVTLIAV
ncbi:hypothetical protein Tco_0620729 [Tanacetum coccineum]